MSGSAPRRGDLVELGGRRSALVVSPGAYNAKVGLALVCPVSTCITGYPFEVALPPGSGAAGVVLADQVRSLDWRARKAERRGRVPEPVLAEVLARILALLDGRN